MSTISSIAPLPVPALLPEHWQELVVQSAIAPAVALANVESFGSGAALHWQDARDDLIRHKRWQLQTGKLANNGHVQTQAGFVSEALTGLQRQYSHLRHGGWRSTTAGLPGFGPFDCWKPAAPRLSADRKLDRRTGLVVPTTPKPIKYETPPAAPGGGGVFAPVVPLQQWQLIAHRAGLPEPDAAAQAAGFWPWLIAHPTVPVLLTEGLKKCLCAISAGWAAVAAPGVTMSWRTDANGEPRLIGELSALAQPERSIVLAFDREEKASTRKKVEQAAATTRWLLQRAGADASIATLPAIPGCAKAGLDDVVVALGPDALEKAVAAALAAPAIDPAVPRLRRPDAEAPADRFLAEALTIPLDRKLVCVSAGMGAGKTQLLAQALRPLQLEGQRVVLISHRRSLGAALAERLGLPWNDEAQPGSDQRHLGIALCIDSLSNRSAMRFNAAEWRGAIVIIDEVAQVLRHALHGRGTAIARRRPEVLDNLGLLLAGAKAVWACDAQLDQSVLNALEAVTGERALLLGSERRPAAGRTLVNHTGRESWRAALLGCLQRRERLWIATTAAEADSQNSAINLAALAAATWPEARVLVADRDTVNDPLHPAFQLAAEPDAVAAQFDVVVASPAVAAGLSITLRKHFQKVFAIAGGTTPATDVAQALARVRDDVVRHLFAPERSPGNALQIGCGSLHPKTVLRHLDRHAQAAVSAALSAGWDADTGQSGPWLQLWAAQAAMQNRMRLTYRDTVLALLEREGYAMSAPAAADAETAAAAKLAGAQLRDLAQAAADEARAAVMGQKIVLTDADAEELLRRRRRLTPSEKAALKRWQIDRAWGLQGATPSPELLDAHEDGAHRKVVLHWALSDPAADRLVARHDRDQARELAPAGRAWAPDLADGLLTPKLTALRALGLVELLLRRDWFSASDPMVEQLVGRLREYGNDVTQVLGLRPGKRDLTAVRQLLALVGLKLRAQRVKGATGRDSYQYRVETVPLPDGIDQMQVVTAWADRIDGPKNPLQKEGQVLAHA